jgi:predicted glycosyltransferase
VLRQIETKAAYAQNKKDSTRTLSEQLAELGNVHLIERYSEGGEACIAKAGFEDSVNLIANADLVIGHGGTISREAALLGVPSIAISDMAKTNVNLYLAKKGFPYFATTERSILRNAEKYLGKHFNMEKELAAMENPVEVIVRVVESLRL